MATSIGQLMGRAGQGHVARQLLAELYLGRAAAEPNYMPQRSLFTHSQFLVFASFFAKIPLAELGHTTEASAAQ